MDKRLKSSVPSSNGIIWSEDKKTAYLDIGSSKETVARIPLIYESSKNNIKNAIITDKDRRK